MELLNRQIADFLHHVRCLLSILIPLVLLEASLLGIVAQSRRSIFKGTRFLERTIESATT